MATVVPGYDEGHFKRVLDHLIKPACGQAGFEPYPAADSTASELIMADVLRQLIESDMVVCDMSSRNPNVFFELGLRQAFDKPVALIKDEKTPRPFDVQGLRDVTYQSSLRVDLVSQDIASVARIIKDTYAKHKTGADTLLRLIQMQSAVIPENAKPSLETQVIMNALADISARISNLEMKTSNDFIWSKWAASPGQGTGPTGMTGIPFEAIRNALDAMPAEANTTRGLLGRDPTGKK